MVNGRRESGGVWDITHLSKASNACRHSARRRKRQACRLSLCFVCAAQQGRIQSAGRVSLEKKETGEGRLQGPPHLSFQESPFNYVKLHSKDVVAK